MHRAYSAPAGELALTSFQFRTDRIWIWYAVIFLIATLLLFTVLTALTLQLVKPPRSDPVVADAEALRKYKMVRRAPALLHT